MLILAGKTCSGKDTIKKELIKLGMTPITTYTTRPMRDGEIDGKTYHFISRDDFLEKAQNGFFAECTYYNVASGDTWYYGSSETDYIEDGVMILNPDGLKDLIYIHNLEPVIIYIDVLDEIISERLISRGDNLKEAKRRLQADNIDFLNIYKMCDVVISNNGEYEPARLAKKIYDVYKTLRRKIDG